MLTAMTDAAAAADSATPPTAPHPEWERRVEDLWEGFGDHPPAAFLARAEALAAELPPGGTRTSCELPARRAARPPRRDA